VPRIPTDCRDFSYKPKDEPSSGQRLALEYLDHGIHACLLCYDAPFLARRVVYAGFTALNSIAWVPLPQEVHSLMLSNDRFHPVSRRRSKMVHPPH